MAQNINEATTMTFDEMENNFKENDSPKANETFNFNEVEGHVNESVKADRRKRVESTWTFDTDVDGNETVTVKDADGKQIHQEKFSKSDLHVLMEERARKNMRKEKAAEQAAKRKKFYDEFCRSYGETMLLGTASSIIAGLVVKAIKHIKK